MGPPWTIPFEFPTFQYAVAGLASTGIGLDNAGRLGSWLFVVGSMYPLWRLAHLHEIDPYIAGTLYLASPLYLFWGSAFLIESCSIFLGAMFLWMLEEDRHLAALAFGVLAAMTKVTTFAGFALLAVCSLESGAIACVLVSLLCTIFWTAWTDVEKSRNTLSMVLMTNQPAQRLHNFGTLAQRLSWEPWRTLWENLQSLF